MDSSLATERIRLRRLTGSDAELLHGLDNDPEVMRYLNGGVSTPRMVIEAELLPWMLAASRTPGLGYWAALERSTEAFLGWFSLRAIDAQPATAELGYRLCRLAWGRGLATEGARMLIDRGFTELGLRQIVASTFEHNWASRRVLEKLGFHLIRQYRLTAADLVASETTYYGGAPVLLDGDDLDYALVREDWEKLGNTGLRVHGQPNPSLSAHPPYRW